MPSTAMDEQNVDQDISSDEIDLKEQWMWNKQAISQLRDGMKFISVWRCLINGCLEPNKC